MKLLFVSTNRLRRVMPAMPLGLASIIAQIDDTRHDIRVLDFMFLEEPEDELKNTLSDFGPDIIAVSIRNIDNQSYLHTEYLLPKEKRYISLCRENSDAVIVVGGPAFTVSPVAEFEYLGADFGIVGEGELAFAELVNRIESKADPSDIPGLVWRDGDAVRMNPRRYIEDLDSLRLPRRDLFDNARYAEAGGFANIVVKQGCAFRCLYCDSPHTMGPRWRMKSPERVAEELESMQKELGVNVVFFTDAIFNQPPEQAKDICRAIMRRGLEINWLSGGFHPACADRELLELMRDAGCRAVSLGCDSCSERMLKVLRKGFTKEQLRSAALLLEEMGINYVLSMLVGGPGEDRETVEESIQFLSERTPFLVDFCVGIRLMPHTALRDIAIEEGVISADDPLMEPRFYLSPHVKDWIVEYLLEACTSHPNWTVAHTEP
ncbi:MAG: B12-binding domain-containing radical SAM protein [Candidatus Abyssubacteria bacterium]